MIAEAIKSVKSAESWSVLPLRERILRVGSVRHWIAENAQKFVEAAGRYDAVTTIAGEIIPLADALKFIERSAAGILRTRRLGMRGRPIWLAGVRSRIERVPMGRVLIIGPGNYPVFLPGVQIAQALAAGNTVVFKPAPGTIPVAKLLCVAFYQSGVPAEALVLLDELVESLDPWLERVDKVLLTGSSATGRAVMSRLAPLGVPSVMELSGCDAAFVLEDADVNRAAAAIAFGLTFNGSRTCLSPRRIFVHAHIADELIGGLGECLGVTSDSGAPADSRLRKLVQDALAKNATLAIGALDRPGTIVLDHVAPDSLILQADILAPVCSIVRFDSLDVAIALYHQCEYRLGASIFSSSALAESLAARIDAGSIVINDLIVPTADPRLPFGGSGRSGFGATRGAEGLLEMTRAKTISIRKRGALHLEPMAHRSAALLCALLKGVHARTKSSRLAHWMQVVREGRKLRKC